MNVFKSPVYVVGTLLLLGATVSSAMLSGTKLGFLKLFLVVGLAVVATR